MALLKKVKLPDDPSPEGEPPPPEDLAPEELTPIQETEEGEADSVGALAEAPADAEPAAEGADALLDMFTTVGVHVEDRTLLLGLAGEVEIDDLISELSIVAAALGIVQAQREAAEEPEQLAA
jgi:hypothetical protein